MLKIGRINVRRRTCARWAAALGLVSLLIMAAPWSSSLAGWPLVAAVVNPGCSVSQGDDAWVMRDFARIDREIEAVSGEFPAEMIKAVAWYESEWQHWEQQGTPLVHGNPVSGKKAGQGSYDVGIMQINEDQHGLDPELWDLERIKIEPVYNIRAGIRVLEQKREYVRYLRRRPDWPRIAAKYDLNQHSEWEMTLKAYNGFRRSWVYPDEIKRLEREKPWEHAILAQRRELVLEPCQSLADPLIKPSNLVTDRLNRLVVVLPEREGTYGIIEILDDRL